MFAILEDARGNFWMSSNQGIYRVSRAQLNDCAEGKISKVHAISYGKADGMLSTECNGARHPSAIKTRDGRMWFPTFNGIAVVDPKAVTLNDVPPPVVKEDGPLIVRRWRVDRSPAAPEEPASAPIQEFLPSVRVGWGITLADHLQRLVDADWPLRTLIDHGTHLAVYLSDPDGNDLELAWDRPFDEWPREGFRDATFELADLLGR